MLASFCLLGVVVDGNAQSDRARQLIGDLQAKKPQTRTKAENALVKMGEEALIAALKDSDPGVRQAVIPVLEKINDPRVVEPVIGALKDSDPGVRRAVVRVLGKINDARVVEPLIDALKDPDAGVRGSAAFTLGNIRDPRAVEPLMAGLKDSDPYFRGSAAVALGKIKDSRAVEPLIAALKDPDAGAREGAVEALGEIGEPATGPLITALKDTDPHLRQNAARALGHVKSPGAASALMAAWNASDLEVIAGASSFFIERGEPGSEDTLIQALKAHGDPWTAMLFNNSGNAKLEAAGREWATANSQRFAVTVPGGGTVRFVRWGSAR
jgi:HEAT repeat protein